MRRLSRDLAHALAAEYVLGTLRGRARSRFEAMARQDGEVAAIVRAWENGITPLAGQIAPVEPPERVWRGIEARIGAPSARASAWNSVFFWRTLAAALTVMLVVALVTIAPRQPAADPMMVAVLSESDGPRAVVMQAAPDELRVRIVKPWGKMEGLSLELWAIPKEGAPRSLGLLANASDRETLMRIPGGSLHDVKALAVTMEPVGGSPTKQPTGSPVCTGPVAAMRRT